MPAFDDLLNQILSSNPKIGRDELLTMVERKKEESHGLLSNEGAIRLLAQQLSASPSPSSDLKDQRISSVHAGLNDSTITGQVIMVSDVHEFQRSDGTHGKVLRMKVGDASGQITGVFWDSLADTVAREALTPGSRVRLLHGYTKFGRAGEVEFHLGSRANIQILGRASSQGFPSNSLSSAAVRVGASGLLRVRLLKLQKSQSEQGPTWALCSNEAELMIAKFWDNQAQNVLELGEGSLVAIENHWITEKNGLVYVNIGSKTSVKKESTDFVPDIPVATVESLRPGPSLWSIKGKVVERSDVREIETKEGRKTRVSNIELEDGTGKIRVSLWDTQAQRTESLRTGDTVRLVGVKVRENMNGEKEASTVFLTQLEKS
jgi:ssDNA-binding replication factor A large subunit